MEPLLRKQNESHRGAATYPEGTAQTVDRRGKKSSLPFSLCARGRIGIVSRSRTRIEKKEKNTILLYQTRVEFVVEVWLARGEGSGVPSPWYRRPGKALY